MGKFSADITNKIYFSTQKLIKNDFIFSISYRSGKKYNNIQNTESSIPLIIYILGLDQLFKNKDEMLNFAKALNVHMDEGWNVSISDDKDLVITTSSQKLESDFSICFNTLYEFTKDFKDNDSIFVKVRFDAPSSGCQKDEWNEYSITAYEMPCIKSIAVLNSKGIETSSIIKGENANIQWKTNVESSSQGSVVLYDENKKEVKANEVTIDKDCTFTLVVTKHEKVESQEIPIKAVYIDKLELQDFNGNATEAIIKGEMAQICWSLVNAEPYAANLFNERAIIVAHTSPYKKIIERNESYTLQLEQDGVGTSQTLQVFCTLWEKQPKYINTPFQLDNLSYNKIIFISEGSEKDGYYLYIHPYLYYSPNLVDWKILTNTNEPFYRQTYYNSTLSIIDDKKSIVTCHIDDLYVAIRNYDLDTNQWEEVLTRKKKDFKGCDDEELLFCHLMKYKCQTTGMYGDIYDSLFVVHEHSIYVRDIHYQGYDIIKCCAKLPEDAGNPTIISIDTIFDDEKNKNYLAILCDDNRVYVYESDKFFRRCNFICKTAKFFMYQKNVYLTKADSIYIITENFQFMLDGNNIIENWFAPRSNPSMKKYRGAMFVGQKDERKFSAIIKEVDQTTLWTYNPTQE